MARNGAFFFDSVERVLGDRTGWLGREDSNLRLAESKIARPLLSPQCKSVKPTPMRPTITAATAAKKVREPSPDLNWLLGSGFCRSRCWLGYHNRIGNSSISEQGHAVGATFTSCVLGEREPSVGHFDEK
jgi:hypothetical protein